MAADTGLRSSTNGGICAVFSFGVVWALKFWAPEFLAASPADPEITGGMISATFYWVGSRFTRTPARPRAI